MQQAQKRPNAWGLYDMHGNVWEWCQDVYDSDYYKRSQGTDPCNEGTAGSRLIRGGSWFNNSQLCRPAARNRFTPDCRFLNLGFRVAMVAAARTN